MLLSRCKCSCKSLAKNVARISNCRRSQSPFEAITTAGPLSCRWSKDMVTLGVPALLGAEAAPRHSIEVMSPIYNWSLRLQLSCDRARCAYVRLTGSRGLMLYFMVTSAGSGERNSLIQIEVKPFQLLINGFLVYSAHMWCTCCFQSCNQFEALLLAARLHSLIATLCLV